MHYEIETNGYDLDDFETIYTLKVGDLYIAFHRETPESIIGRIQSTLDKTKADGTFDSIAKNTCSNQPLCRKPLILSGFYFHRTANDIFQQPRPKSQASIHLI